MYLDPARAGIGWLLDPEDPAVVSALRRAASRTPQDSCDADALRADLPGVLTLIRERHFGVATGVCDGTGLEEWAERWERRLADTKPSTWGEAVGTDVLDLRRMLGDAHVKSLQHEDPERLAAQEPRASEAAYEDDGPAYEERVVDGVLCVRVRRLMGGEEDERALAAWRESHERHFGFDRIVVDLRGNRGGNDGHLYEWAEPHCPREVHAVPGDRGWYVDGRPLGSWNSSVQMAAVHGSVPPGLQRHRPQPHPEARIDVQEDEGIVPAGDQPWHGRMVVVTDRRTTSSGESSAWALRQMFGARIVGGPSEGSITFGNVTPYLLPRSGMRLNLPTKQNLYPDVEFVGVPVDEAIDPRIRLEEVVERFLQNRSGFEKPDPAGPA